MKTWRTVRIKTVYCTCDLFNARLSLSLAKLMTKQSSVLHPPKYTHLVINHVDTNFIAYWVSPLALIQWWCWVGYRRILRLSESSSLFRGDLVLSTCLNFSLKFRTAQLMNPQCKASEKWSSAIFILKTNQCSLCFSLCVISSKNMFKTKVKLISKSKNLNPGHFLKSHSGANWSFWQAISGPRALCLTPSL